MRSSTLVLVTALAGLAACTTNEGSGDTASTPAPPATSTSVGGSTSAGVSSGTGGTSIGGSASGGVTTSGSSGGMSGGTTPPRGTLPTLISVNLQNVLNNLSVSLQVDRNSIPVTAQVPIDVAAAVCGVSVDALAASVASGRANCTATTTSAQLNQVVQQQISTGGDVQGGAQTLNTGTRP